MNYQPTYHINPIEKLLEAIEENKRLYGALLKEKDEKITLLQKVFGGEEVADICLNRGLVGLRDFADWITGGIKFCLAHLQGAWIRSQAQSDPTEYFLRKPFFLYPSVFIFV